MICIIDVIDNKSIKLTFPLILYGLISQRSIIEVLGHSKNYLSLTLRPDIS